MQIAVLIDERDRRLGKVMVNSATVVIGHADRIFVRTGKSIRPNPRLNAMAVVFEEAKIYTRDKLEPL
jgi:hypothetical protein